MVSREAWAAGVLIADGLGCLVAATAVVAFGSRNDKLGPILPLRLPLAAALGATGAALLALTRNSCDDNLARAAAVNGAWVSGCLVGLTSRDFTTRHTTLSRSLVAATAVSDAAMGVVQLSLRT